MVKKDDVSHPDLPDNSFDLATAFETIYLTAAAEQPQCSHFFTKDTRKNITQGSI